MASVEILRAARARIANPAHWTVRALARYGSDGHAPPNSPAAVCWCAFGALQAEEPEFYREELTALNATARELFEQPLITVNDTLGHAAVLKVYDHAIAKAEAGV